MNAIVPNAGRSPFSHLSDAAVTRPRAEDNNDDEEMKAKKAEEDKKKDDEAKAKKAEEDKKKEEDDAKAKKAEDDKKKEDAKAEGDDESDDKDEKDPDAKAARARERGRIKAIFNSEAGKANPDGAWIVAIDSSMSRDDAIVFLGVSASAASAAKPAAARDRLRDRMNAEPIPAVGAGDASADPNLAQSIIMAGKKRRGEA